VLAIELTAEANVTSLGNRMTDFNALGFRVNIPGDLSSTIEEVAQPPVNLRTGVVG
jgi:hypothetical protein